MILFLSLFASLLLAQIVGIEDSFKDVWGTIKIISPMILGAILLVGFRVNTGHSFGRIQISSAQLHFQDWDYSTKIISFRDGNMLMKYYAIFLDHFLRNSVLQNKYGLEMS